MVQETQSADSIPFKGISEKSLVGIQNLTIFSDPPIALGSNSVLLEHKKNSEMIHDKITMKMQKFQENFDIKETIEMMEKQLYSAIEKGAQILKASKDMNYAQKMDLLYKHDKAGKKLGSDEVYILSQKNLVNTMDKLNHRIQRKFSEEENELRNSIEEDKDEKLIEESKNEPVKIEALDESNENLNNIEKINSPKSLKLVQNHIQNDQTVENNTVHDTVTQNNRVLEKPCVGLRKTAFMMSRMFGGDQVKKRIKKEVDKKYDDLYQYMKSDDKR